jgi:GTP-binding protein Era
MAEQAGDHDGRRCGFVALIGAPNAGKSTLVNRLVGAKVSIVSQKAQTTRAPIRGILMSGPVQIILVDTPGIFTPKRRLDRAMVEAAWSGAREADVTVLVVDAARGIDEGVEAILARLGGRPAVLVLNKVDRVKKDGLLAIAGDLNGRHAFSATFMVSALDGSGVEDLARHLAAAMPEGPWLYPEDQVADAPMRLLAAEITREKIYKWLHDELPYASTVETSGWQEKKDGSVRIEQTILVEREGQRAIVLGHKGETVKRISMEARKEIGEVLERPVHLFLFVKVREGWGDERERYGEMGLEFPD